MELPEHILLVYGYALLFGWILIGQLGAPLPATPVMLAAGALSAENELNFGLSLLSGLTASMIANSIWFFAGRHYGHVVFRLLCRLSIEPTTCVRKTEISYARRHGVTLMFARFIPGLSILVSPVAGKMGMRYRGFLLFDALGACIWVGTLLLAGRFFGAALLHKPHLLDAVGRISGALLLLGVAGFLVARFVRRRVILRRLISARLEPQELKQWLDAGEQPFIVDLRGPIELEEEPFLLPGAVHISMDALTSRHSEIPRDREIVVYCACRPSDGTAVRTATAMQKLGVDRVRPLRGGYHEWKRLGFPMDAMATRNHAASVTGVQDEIARSLRLG